ncbi:TPA: tRNA epoxyqueuosine(34) reductase QueG [Clostridioides difficile]|nr:tRNA epoxyqueuosine(34) reductase QueG [Clostridioides difficile]HCQ6178801.1 tRNA epoxyqueuosine(34) reductase QueG [Clostridioides difficile]
MDNKELKAFCNLIGLNCVGVAGVDKYDNLEKILKDRQQKGYLTGMEEPIIENRINPRHIMKDANSIIVCAFPYHINRQEKNKNSNLSKYCHGKDYHIVVKDFLQQICDYISKTVTDFKYKLFADNGPLVDRYLAYLSGIGYFGINNNIITDEYGSYVFIGYIVNNYKFEEDKPLEKSCFKCGKCVKYCPGNAILGNYDMNPKKCLSYITQKKEDLSEKEKVVLKNGKKVFGCDICQEVCPHNVEMPTTHILEFKENIIDYLDYDEIQNISNKEFKRRYGDRAFSWRGRNIIKRNMEIILDKYDD